jgi:hypothetical protein
MTHETLEAVELGQAEALIEIYMPDTHEELVEKYVPGAVPYVEFE